MIIDAFPFMNELEIVEIRLNELDSLVDHFVIVESLEVHGNPRKKPANLRDNWHIVKPFEHKVTYILLDHLEPPYTDDDRSRWGRENYQRLALTVPVTALSTSPEDIIIVSDCDEIPRESAVRDALPRIATGIHQLSLDFFYYNVNCCVNKKWAVSTIGTLKHYQEIGGFQIARNTGRDCGKPHRAVIEDAGWHFSYFGHDAAKLKYKAENVAESHRSMIADFINRDPRQATIDIANCVDIYRDPTMPMIRRDTHDPRLPAYFLNNIERFKHCTDGK